MKRSDSNQAGLFRAFYFALWISILVLGSASVGRSGQFTKIEQTFLLEQYSYLETDQSESLGWKTPLILVHGIDLAGGAPSNSVDGWDNFIAYFNSKPELTSKFKIYKYGYQSNRFAVADISTYLSECLNRLDSETLPQYGPFPRKEFVILAHSMGGLVARSFMNESRDSTGEKWEKSVIKLITLATPHHGTPAANKCVWSFYHYVGALGVSLSNIDTYDYASLAASLSSAGYLLGKMPDYSKYNRSDLLWDNFDNKFKSGQETDEITPSTASSYKSYTFNPYDSKIIAYAGSIVNNTAFGQLIYPDHPYELTLPAQILANGLGYDNDGIVPVESSHFQPRAVTKRYFPNYDHYQMMHGKGSEANPEDPLFDTIRDDLIAAIPVVPALPPGVPSSPGRPAATAISSGQINLSWTDVANETGYVIKRITQTGGYVEITTGANVTSISDTNGLAPLTDYYYQVMAINPSGNSTYSPAAAAKTLPSATVSSTRSLTVESLNPASGVAVTTWIGNGSSGITYGTTPTSRSFETGTVVGVVCAESTTDGMVFQKWQLDGVDQQGGTYKTVTMNVPHRLVAIYRNSASSTKSLSSILINGPSSVSENTSQQYTVTATFTDGTAQSVSPTWSENSSSATMSSSGVLDAGAVASDTAVTINASFSSGGVTKTTSKSITILNTDVIQAYTLTVNSSSGGRVYITPNQKSYAAGTVVQLISSPNDGYVRSGWSGDASGSDRTIYLTMDGNKSVTASFIQDTSNSAVNGVILPAQAAVEGGAWMLSPYTGWQFDGDHIGLVQPGTHSLSFKPIPGWIEPEGRAVQIVGGQPMTITGTYREILGSVQVTINPTQAAQAGARWRLNGGAWKESGVTVPDVPTGSNLIEYLPLSGWTAPSNQTITVNRGAVSTPTGDYGPPAGVPIITSVAPRTGPIEGNTTVTIEGANFQPGATVTFGGVAAKSVTVDSPTRITAVTPSRTSYGTVALSLTSAGQTITQSNGFSYLKPIGTNMDLVGQIGGSFLSVEVQGNYAYIGEGACFVVMDISNPSSPIERGRLPMPALVNGIAVINGKAYVACGAQGFFVLDIAAPASPSIVGFYATSEARAVVADGNVAYLADGDWGLKVIDVSNASAPTLLSSLDTPGWAQQIQVGNYAGKKCAFIADGNGGVRIIDVTVPSTPFEIAVIPTSNATGTVDIKTVGTKLYASGYENGIQVFDMTNPSQPVLNGSYPYIFGAPIDVVGTTVYAGTSLFQILNTSSPASISQIGQLNLGFSSYRLRVSGGYAYIAAGTKGFKVISIANSNSPVLAASKSGLGIVDGIAVNGNVLLAGKDSGGMDTIDVSNPAHPILLAHLDGQSRVSNIGINGNTAVLVNWGEKKSNVVDVSNPFIPKLLSICSADLAGFDVAMDGTNVLIAGGDTRISPYRPRLDIVSLASPTLPQNIKTLQLSSEVGSAQCVTISGNWAFVVASNKAFYSIDISNRAEPVVSGTISIPISGEYNPPSISASPDGNYVYVAEGTDVRIISVTSKSSPQLVATFSPPETHAQSLSGVLVVGTKLYVSDTTWVFVYDISDPANPVQVANYDIPRASGMGTILQVQGDLLYVAGGDTGITILKLKDIDKPVVTISGPVAAPVYVTTNATVSLFGTASDSQKLNSLTWKNNRGGGGVVSGTKNWQANDIHLLPGENVITITAEDANGNLGTAILTVTATQLDVTSPVVSITAPRLEKQFTVISPSVDLSGAAADNIGVTELTWTNDRGGSGSAQLTQGTWIVPNLTLQEGPNKITMTAKDASGNISSDSSTIFYLPPDSTPPTVTIDFPTVDATYATSSSGINISGQSDDDQGVAKVEWSNSRGGSGVSSGFAPWSANNITLQPGLNIIDVTATDTSGNISTDSLSVTFTPQAAPSPSPSPSPNTPTPSPTPAPSPTPSPVPIVAGMFNGLVGDQKLGNGTESENMAAFFVHNGFLSLSTKTDRTFTGSLRLEGRTLSFKGKFSATGKVAIPVKFPDRSIANVALTFDPSEPAKITGNVTTDGTPKAFEARASLHDLSAKRYTIILPAPDTSVGHGYATLVIAPKGTATLAGKLADGTSYTTTSQVVDDGNGNWLVPVHIPLYQANGGMLIGEIVLPKPEPADAADASGTLEWLRPKNDRSKVFGAGFLKSLEPTGENYQPQKGISLLTGTDATGIFTLTVDPQASVLTAPLGLSGAWQKSNTPSLTKPAKISFTLRSGIFKGTFFRTLGGKAVSTPYEGVVLGNALTLPGDVSPVRGGGFFSTGSAAAPVEISSP